MKIFIVHANKDKEQIHKYLDLLKQISDIELLILEDNTNKNWKIDARKKIKEADCALYFVGKDSYSRDKTIGWELKQFINRDKKIFTSKLEDGNLYNQCLYKKTFGNKEYIDKDKFMYSTELDIKNIKDLLEKQINTDISESVLAKEDVSENTMLEQYKVYLQTSEDLVQRRQSVSNFYISVNSALVSVLSILIAIINIFGSQYAMIITACGCYILSFCGIVLCLTWKRIILSYGRLNAAKMKVISAIERNLPLNLYDVEWQVQSEKIGKDKYISFTNIEKRIPTLFLVLYSAMAVAAVVLTVLIII